MPAWAAAPIRPSTVAFTVLCSALWNHYGWSFWTGVSSVCAWHLFVSYASSQ